MSFLGTFDGFTTARLGIIAAQNGLSLTGNNISNINTTGYTRQVLDQVALKTGGHDRYASQLDLHMGTGTLCTGISQIRDPYLDIRYRNEWSAVGTHDTWLAGLNDIADVLDETADGTEGFGLLTDRLSDMMTALQNLNTYTGEQDYDTLVRSAADAMCQQFQAYANELQTLYNNTETALKTDLTEINNILTSIQELNVQIRKGDIHGDACLEMRDDRNVLIDQLSQFMKIDVIYETEDLGGGDWVEKLVIKLGSANPAEKPTENENATLIDGIYAVQFEMPEKMPMVNTNYDATVTDPTDPKYGKYLKEDENGGYIGTNDITEAASALVPVKNTAYDPNETDTTAEGYGQYLKPDGTGTNDIDDADMIMTDNTNYDLFLTQLKDTYGRVMKEHGKEVPPAGQLDDNDLYGSLQSTRELLTECGEFASDDTIAIDPNAATKRGIPYYQQALDLLARKFAETFNAANNGCMVNENGNYIDAAGEELTFAAPPGITYYEDTKGNYLGIDAAAAATPGAVPCTVPALNGKMPANAQQAFLDSQGMTVDEYVYTVGDDNGNTGVHHDIGGNLFSNNGDSNDSSGITASNISVSINWAKGDVHVVPTYTQLFGGDVDNSTQGSNVEYMITLFETAMIYNPQDLVGDASSSYLFKGSYHDMLNNICSVLGNDQRSTGVMFNTAYAAALELDTSRDGVMGVDLNDETMNMMKYQKALTAAYRILTVLDDCLDKLINNTAV